MLRVHWEPRKQIACVVEPLAAALIGRLASVICDFIVVEVN
jgi:hypothetical protein